MSVPTRWEVAAGTGGRAGMWRPPGGGRAWATVWALAVAWSVGGWLIAEGSVINASGWSRFAEFFRAALTPQLSGEFLARTGAAALSTLSYAVLGTLLAVVVGLVVGVLVSETWWATGTGARTRRRARRAGWLLTRLGLALPRGVHEAVWALLLLSVLGRDPLVGVLAIAIPFGAITAKVYAEIIDESARGPYEALRAAGAGRAVALLYAVLPIAWPELVSYAFYRFECAVRSAVVLGMVGAGGLGFELVLSFSGSRHAEVWTLIYTIVVIGAVVERWGAGLRRADGVRRSGISAVAALGLVLAALVHLGPDLSRVVSSRTAELLAGLMAEMVPPGLPEGGWVRLLEEALVTLQMSLVAGTIAAVAAVAVAFVAARGGTTLAHRSAGMLARWLLLLTRSLPPPVWALLFLFLLLPGPLPGALALGVYNFGILGRLYAEVVENIDRRPHDHLVATGAPAVSAFGYAIVPQAGGRFLAYGLYRWEVALRETVVVGIVGAGGLGRLLEDQRVAFDLDAMAGTVLALIALCALVDMISTTVRRTLR
ncbi:ABC transporter permease subunit [Kocuria sp.]|uniref:ABC transporter permease subunit n=1 Tax=Kocuria sp. TaxID=1871328 RepID=UPI002811EC6C|nr:ABC transporter permease subunit [Kocuria sp.]